MQLSERSEPRIPWVYRVPKAPSMRVYIINSLVCLCVCLYVPYGRLNGWADFKNILHVHYPWVRDGFGRKNFLIGPKKKFFFGRKFFFFQIFRFFKFFFHFSKISKFPKKFSCKNNFFRKKTWEKQICNWASEASHVYLEYIGCRRHPLCECTLIKEKILKFSWISDKFL